MNKDFPRIISLLRKERGISQKQAATDLEISPALLSHYEKGIRECGLDFILKVADYYDVSCDYLLGKSPDRDGYKISVDEIEVDDSSSKDSTFKGNIVSVLNKKLILNSLNIIFDILQKSNNKNLINAVSKFFMLSIYKVFRILYSGNKKNPQDFFSVPKAKQKALSDATQFLSENEIECSVNGNGKDKKSKKPFSMSLSPEIISQDYPKLASSLYNLIQRTESGLIKDDL